MTRLERLLAVWAAVVAMAALAATPALAGGTITLDRAGMRAGPDLAVTSPAFPPGGTIPPKYSAWDDDVSIPLTWSLGPARTRSFAVLIEDPDAATPTPVVHWLLWNLAPVTISLAEGVKQDAKGTAREGGNSHNDVGYYGPHPPAGDPPHHYHIEVFGLDQTLRLAQGKGIDDLAKAMAGHVVAHGELIGLLQRPEHPKHP